MITWHRSFEESFAGAPERSSTAQTNPSAAEYRDLAREKGEITDSSLIADRPDALSHLAAAREGTVAFIESTRGRDLSAYRFPHLFLGSLNIYDWVRTIAYHELRHAKQIREVVETFHQ